MEISYTKHLAAATLLTAAAVSFAQNNKVTVAVNHSGNDSIGGRLAYAVREKIRGSRAYELRSTRDSIFDVNIITLNPDSQANSYWSVASVTYTMTNYNTYVKNNPQTWYSIYLTSVVLTVGSGRVEEQASNIVANLDEAVEKFKRDADK